MIKLSFPLIATATLAAALVSPSKASIENCYGTTVTDAIDGAIVGGVVGAIAGNAKTGALVGAGAGVIDGEYTRSECAYAADEAAYQYEADAEYEYEVEAEMEYEAEAYYEQEAEEEYETGIDLGGGLEAATGW
ncbi:hypothetical protein JCM19240_2417 [Vibrio maritimus]|uniref:Glycine zipper domain-containing protein n=1 Tax=Vibrio maritimus TaxID=990268 RepID=A0A090T190_9VIBR|nr:hypothetical protein JCM19240_2417 [Vibrio maritimus]